MPIDLRSLRPAALVKALSRQLRSSRWRGVCRGAVLSVQRSKLRIAVLEFVAFSLPWAGGLWVYNQHSTWPSWVAVVLPVSSGILGGILLGGLPLALVSFYEHKRIEIGRRTCLRVVEVLNELPRIEPDVLTGKPTQLLPKVVELISECEKSHSTQLEYNATVQALSMMLQDWPGISKASKAAQLRAYLDFDNISHRCLSRSYSQMGYAN